MPRGRNKKRLSAKPKDDAIINAVDCGFNHICIPKLPASDYPAAANFPEHFVDDIEAIKGIMECLAEKLEIVKTYVSEVINAEHERKGPTSEDKVAQLFIEPPLPIGFEAQDLLRLLLHTKIIIQDAVEELSTDSWEYTWTLIGHKELWNQLRVIIGDQLPGNERQKEWRADQIMIRVIGKIFTEPEKW